MTSLLQDVRYTLRTFAQAPAFTLVALVVLAVGIGGNTAMFTLVNAMIFQPLPGQGPGIVGLFSHDRTKPDSYRAFSYPNYVDVRDASHDVFDGVMAHTFAMAGLPAGDTLRRTFVELVSSNYFDTLQVPLAAGRSFTAEEERPGAALPVAIVPYERWQAAKLDPAFIGSTIRINATDFTIVGVAPRGFGGTMALVSPEFWLPFGMYDSVVNDMFKNKGTGLVDRTNETLILVGRLKPGITVESALPRLDAMSRQLESAFPAENRNQLITVNPLPRMSTSTEPQSDSGLAIAGAALMGVSASVLLIASLNLANMLLARGTSRRKEIAIRLALGGARGRIVRQLVTESLVLALGGAAAGMVLAYWAISLLVANLAGVLPLSLMFNPRPDLNVLAATTAFAVIATLMFGVGPALKLSRRDLVNDLKELLPDSSVFGRRLSARNILVTAQLTLSLVLLIAGGLFGRSAVNAAASNPGFSYEGGILVSLDPSLANYDEARGQLAYRATLERIRALPGVAAAGFASTVPFGEFHEGRQVQRVGAGEATDEPPSSRSPTYRIIGADYFRALGLPMLRGREFTLAEETSSSTPRVAIIDDRLAAALFRNEDPIGQVIRLSRQGDSLAAEDLEPMVVVGVAPSIREAVVDRAPLAHIYVPWGRHYRAGMHVHVRGSAGGDAAMSTLMASIRTELRAVDATLPVLQITTLQQFHDRGLVLWAVRTGGRMLTVFGILALALAVIGVYGVKAYIVSQRTREIGIRMALGASARHVRSLLLKEAMVLTAAGIALGLPVALLLGRALGSMLFSVSASDPLIFVGAPAILAAASMLASYIPARRAVRVDPTTALRAQ